jgi:hypothetical protein
MTSKYVSYVSGGVEIASGCDVIVSGGELNLYRSHAGAWEREKNVRNR